MSANVRPRRSVLYMPGSNARALEKAKTLAADALILDLEDAVAPDAKCAARDQVCAALRAGGYGGRELIVRINGLDTPWGSDDLAAVAKAGPHAVLLPKVDDAGDVQAAEELMAAAGGPGQTTLWCMMETPGGILAATEIAGASRRLGALVMGTSDLTKDLQARHTADRQPMLTSLSLVVLAARAHGLAVIDGVHLDLEDPGGFIVACRQGRDLGFDGKTLIHPRQIAACNEVFAPDEAEIAFARRIIATMSEAEREGKGVVVVDGKLIENLHVEEARHRVALADAIADLERAAP